MCVNVCVCVCVCVYVCLFEVMYHFVQNKAAATGPLVAFCMLGNFGPDTGQAKRGLIHDV